MISSNPNRIYDSNLQDKSSHDCIIDKSNPINNISNDIIQINLFDPVVIIRGNVNESVGSLLRGEIILTLNKPMKIGSIELKFIGRTKIVRPNGVEIIRMLTDYINYSGIEISRSYDKIIDYQLSIPKKSYTLDDIIPINIKIIPLIKQFRLHSIECFLLQKITYMKDDDHTETIKNSNYNNIIRFNEHYDKIYETNMNFELNKCRDIIIHHSVDTPLIRIKHELRFCLLVSITKSDYGIKSKLYFNIGINLLSRLVRNDDVLLPNYDDVNDERSCDGLTCNFCNLSNNNKPPRYSKTI
ncbi:9216_t:CDS:2 [Rhizophagus irregularis]|nr:9216_t:CDS:2 [Rhizophagus irregularis]